VFKDHAELPASGALAADGKLTVPHASGEARVSPMRRRFTGWPEQAFDVLLYLQGEPSRREREAHRKGREHLVRKPMIALFNDLADMNPAYDDFSVWGFRKTSWWWQHQGGVIRIARNVEIGLRFDLDGLRIQGAWWYPDPDQLACFRTAVDDEERGGELTRIVESLQDAQYEITGDIMKRPPRGYSADHPRLPLLLRRSLIAARPLGCEDWLHHPDGVDHVHQACKELDPLLAWLADQVNGGPR